MGFYPISKVTIERVYGQERHILVTWRDEVLQKTQEQKFEFTEADKALEFVRLKIMELVM